ncbi:MAG: GNAT family N-acetyltransferase, partial [Dermatophilaceae bacterium]
GLERVVAETMVVNLASRAVMRKAGMRHTGVEHREWDDPLPGAEQGEWLAELTRAEWLAGRSIQS